MTTPPPPPITRVQTGVRIEASILSVLKGLGALWGMTLGDLLEGIVLHAFEGKCAFDDESLARIAELKKVYGLELTASDSHRLVEVASKSGRSSRPRASGRSSKRTGGKRK